MALSQIQFVASSPSYKTLESTIGWANLTTYLPQKGTYYLNETNEEANINANSWINVYDSARALKNNFAAWATPQVQLYLTELTKMIDPNLYDQIIGMVEKRRRKGYVEKVGGIAEPKTEEQTDVDSMGPF